MTNLLLNTDSYKHSHFKQYPPGTAYVSSYIEARTGGGEQEVVFFGLQMFLYEYLQKQITSADIRKAARICRAHGVPFNEEGWRYILEEHNGFLPLRIEALPEGTVVPRGTPLVQVINTDPTVPWLTSFVETALLRAIWYPTTVATESRAVKKTIMKYLTATCDEPEEQIDFKLHDFGARGATCEEQAGIGGLAHLVNFKGTDTMSSLMYAIDFYQASGDIEKVMPAYSVPASEHSTMTAWGPEGETEAYRNMLNTFPQGIVSIVSDSYDLKTAVGEIFGKELRETILARPGTLVVRPDSGDPVDMVLMCLNLLERDFGSELNSKGYKVLHPKVRILQGDGLDHAKLEAVLAAMKTHRWSAENVVFGMGGGLLQKVNRDTLRFAMKASAICDSNGWRSVGKDPKTDPTKASKKGLLGVYQSGEGVVVKTSLESQRDLFGNLLRTVYEMTTDMEQPKIGFTTFDQVRERAAI